MINMTFLTDSERQLKVFARLPKTFLLKRRDILCKLSPLVKQLAFCVQIHHHFPLSFVCTAVLALHNDRCRSGSPALQAQLIVVVHISVGAG